MLKIRRILSTVLVVILALLIIIPLGVVVGINNAKPQSFPQTDGELRLAGLDGPVDVYRDNMGIPHIYATTLHDLFMVQGYVHAQDRFWQMDFWRHIGSGRLSEMFGKGQLKTDMFLRTLGWRQIAEQEYASLPAESKAILDSYSDGVNAYIQSRSGADLSLEYVVLGALTPSYQPEPWTPIHSLTWAKAMAWDLRGNMGAEIERAVLSKTLTPEQLADLYPKYPDDHPVIVTKIGDSAYSAPQTASSQKSDVEALLGSVRFESAAANLALLDPLLGPSGPAIGSNSWAVSGTRTTTGKPLLANDPHLGIQMPSIWYQVGLHCAPKSDACPYEVAGFSFAGVPGVVIGHNDHIAWGFTNTGPDVMDLYVLKVNPDNPNQYEYNGAWIDFQTRTEKIAIGGTNTPEQLTVRISRFGPVISDTYGPLSDTVEPKSTDIPFKDKAGIELPPTYAIALRWTALEPGSVFEAIWGFNKAKNWDEFRAAAHYFAVPAQNLLYADIDGNIGYQMPGNVPIRKKGDGTVPVPGWTDEYEWTGYIPFDELPYTYNPASGYIVTANNQVPPRDYPYLVTTDWDYGFRAQRIVDMIEQAPGKIDIAYIQKMQGDDKSLNAETLVPILMQVPLDSQLAAVRDQYLAKWDYQETMDSSSAALFESFWWNLVADTFLDENMPKEYQPAGGSRTYEIMRNLVKTPDSAWWDDKTTPNQVETRDDIFAKAFAEAVKCDVCVQKFGSDISKWKWGDLHSATFRNGTLGKSGIGVIENLFNRGPFPAAGGESIVNATGWDIYDSFEVNWLPSMRMIVDLSDLNNSVTVHTTGQSGHADHPHYIDMADLWRNIQYYPMWWNLDSIQGHIEGHLRLLP